MVPRVQSHSSETTQLSGDPVITIENPPGVSDWIGVGLTVVLILVTLWYAKHARDTVHEMRLARCADREQRRREKSDRAAYECLAILRDLSDEMLSRGSSAIDPRRFLNARHTLVGEGALINDEQVRDRLSACAEVLLVGSFDNSMMEREGLSPRGVSSLLEEIVRASRRIVETYLAERPIGREMWARSAPDGGCEQLPDTVDARAWVYRLSGSDQPRR